MGDMKPCPSTATAVLGVVGAPVEVRCGLLDGHEGRHVFTISWDDDADKEEQTDG